MSTCAALNIHTHPPFLGASEKHNIWPSASLFFLTGSYETSGDMTIITLAVMLLGTEEEYVSIVVL